MNFLFLLVLVVFAGVILFMLAIHFSFRAPRVKSTHTPKTLLDIDYSLLSIPTENEKQLSAWFLEAPKATNTLVVLHGWGSNAEMMLPLAAPFYKVGLNVLLLDARSHGNSDKDTFSSLPRFAEDAQNAVTWLKYMHPGAAQKVALLGHSVGAAAVLLAASRRKDISAVISVSAFAHPTWMMQRYLNTLHVPSFIQPVILRYVEWVIGNRFNDIAPINTIRSIGCPVLLVHGNEDNVVPIEDSRAILTDSHSAHVRLVEVDAAGHDSVDKIESHSHKLIDFLSETGLVE